MEKTREEVAAQRKIRNAEKKLKKKGSVNKQNQACGEVPITKTLEENMEKLKISDKKISGLDDSKKVPKVTNEIVASGSDSCQALKKNSKKVEKKELPENTSKPVEKSPCTTKPIPETEEPKSKSQLKAERRAKQEAQRALKVLKKSDDVKEETISISKTKSLVLQKDNKENRTNDSNKVKMVSHLYLDTNTKEADILKKFRSGVHKSVVKLGVQYKNKIIIGSNARVVAFLNTVKQVLTDFTSENNFSREFETVLESQVQYLKICRPPSVSMTNAVKHLKWHLLQLPSNVTNPEAQIKLRDIIDEYVKDQIYMAGIAICITVQKKISQGDVILTFGYSSLIERILVESFKHNIQFRVIIVDAGPLYEGKELLRRLVKNGLDCIYVLLSAASYIMKEATKVLLGAHALLTNGYVMSRAGSSQVALIARSYNVPVLVCCETHKFSERVQTDALVYNELGDPEKLMKSDLGKSNNYLKYLTLMYDVTPSDLVTAVVTELAILPCTSVPAVLRVKPANPTLT